jgi:TonB family protein
MRSVSCSRGPAFGRHAALRTAFVVALAAVLSPVALPATSVQAQPRARTPPKLTKAPKLATFVEAAYPEAERASGRTATVVLEIAISATGAVDDALVTESGGAAFDAAALDAVRRFVFEPAELDGKPAPVKITYRYTFTLKVELPTTAVFDGVVRTRGSKRPLARVALQIDGGPRVVTDEAGRFHVDGVPPGKRGVAIEGEKITALRTEETFEAGKRLEATYEIEEPAAAAPGAPQDDVEVVVKLPPLRKQVVSTEVPADQARKVPGAAGDVLKVVENLPGVARATVGSGALVVWGSAPTDTRVYIDGVRVPNLYHYGGLRSVVHADMVQSVELAPGGYGAAYGRGLGGLVTVQLKPLEQEGFHGSVAADVFDAAGATRVSVGDKFYVAVAARKSWLDLLLPAITSANTSSLFPLPRYADGQIRAGYRVDPHTMVEVGGMISSDSTSSTTPDADPALRVTQTTSLFWTRVYARYRHETDGGGVVTITPWFGTESSSLVSQFGGTPDQLGIDSKDFAVRASWRGQPLPGFTASLGLDAEADVQSVSRFGSITAPPREGDVRVFGQAPVGQTNADAYNVVLASAAPYIEGDLALAGDKVHILPGLRFDPYVLAPSRITPVVGATPSIGALTSEPLFEPRLALTYDASPRARLKLAYGRYHQTPQPEDLSAVFGNPRMSSARADHFLVGTRFGLVEALSVEATGFYTTSTDLAARSASPTPPLAAALAQTGSGRSYGVQILVRKDLGHGIFGWLGYTLSRAERQDQPNGRWRLFDYDQTHVLTALASYAIGKGFEVGARVRAATGYPRTPVAGSYFDARTDTYQPVFGAQNTIRIPAFVSLDVRGAKTFTLGKTELEVYLEVQNVTDRQNPEEIVYTQNYSSKAYITGLPILPSLGARFSW